MFEVDVAEGPQPRLTVTGPGRDGVRRSHHVVLAGRQHGDYLDAFEALAGVFGTRLPLSRDPGERPTGRSRARPLLTEPLGPHAPYGYGDPCVTFAPALNGEPDAWYLLVTSNDAPDVFPILRSEDLQSWTSAGCAFPEGLTPAWCLNGPDRADFWAPELHRLGETWWLCFTARQHSGELAIGLASADHPKGPYSPKPLPLVTGGAIDGHIVEDRAGAPYLVWKEDSNDLWPRLLAGLLHRRPDLIPVLFPTGADRRTAALVAALSPWAAALPPMEQFFAHQPLIEAAGANFAALRQALAAQTEPEIATILEAMRTRILAQPLDPATMSLTGQPRLLLENDQPWEAHLIEGVWITRQRDRSYLFYAGNDFSTQHYGIGVAVADHPLGPYRKPPDRLLNSTADWWGPGHPSVAPGVNGEPTLFFHAFRPGDTGYKAFRALLSATLCFDGDAVTLAPREVSAHSENR